MSEEFKALPRDQQKSQLVERLGKAVEDLAIAEAEALTEGEIIEANCYRAQLNQCVRKKRELESGGLT